MKQVYLPRFNPNAQLVTDSEKLRRYTLEREATRRRRIRNQRLGDATLGAACVGLGWLLVYLAAGLLR